MGKRGADLTLQFFGRLFVVEHAPTTRQGRRCVCRCECGKEVIVAAHRLESGETRSCGCLRRDVTARAGRERARHGNARQERTPIYRTWTSMLSRCSNPNDPNYPAYGGAGITVCIRWHSFELFAADMGPRPAGMTIDREWGDGNYEPGNCRWATPKTQTQNRRSTHWIEHDGRKMARADWARELGYSPQGLAYRLQHMPLAQAMQRKGS